MWSLGNGGVYLALSDFWLDYASGSFYMELGKDRALNAPCIKLRLAGGKEKEPAADGAEAKETGVQTKIKLEGFKLAGDKGKGVPKLAFDVINITVAFSLSMRLHYDMKAAKWCLPRSDMQLKILSFKGPYGLNRR